MSLDKVKQSTDRLRDVIQTENSKSEPQVDLVMNSRGETREFLSETYQTKPETVDVLADTFKQYLDQTEETKGWYGIWKDGENPQFWQNVYRGFMKDEHFLERTSKLDENSRGQMVRPLSWMVIADRFIEENKKEINLDEFVKESIFFRDDVKEELKKVVDEKIQELEESSYSDTVKNAGEKFWDGLTDLADMVEGNLALLGVASLIPVVPGVYSGADIAVAINGYHEWQEGRETNNKQLSKRGILKMVVSVIPMLPGSYAAPIVDKAIKIDKK